MSYLPLWKERTQQNGNIDVDSEHRLKSSCRSFGEHGNDLRCSCLRVSTHSVGEFVG